MDQSTSKLISPSAVYMHQNTNLVIHENAYENIVCDNGGHFVRGEMSKKSTSGQLPKPMKWLFNDF